MSQIAWAHILSLRQHLASRDVHCLSLTNTKSVCVQNLGFQHSMKISFPCKALTPRTGKKGQPTLLSRISGHSAVAGCPCLWCRTYWFGTCLQLKGSSIRNWVSRHGWLLLLLPQSFWLLWSMIPIHSRFLFLSTLPSAGSWGLYLYSPGQPGVFSFVTSLCGIRR